MPPSRFQFPSQQASESSRPESARRQGAPTSRFRETNRGNSGRTGNVHEKEGAYRQMAPSRQSHQKSKMMKINKLSRLLIEAPQDGPTPRKMKDSPGMLMQTKGRIWSLSADPGMLHKNKALTLINPGMSMKIKENLVGAACGHFQRKRFPDTVSLQVPWGSQTAATSCLELEIGNWKLENTDLKFRN